MKRIKFVGELTKEQLDPIVKEVREIHNQNDEDIYNFVNSKLTDVQDALEFTSYKILRDENGRCVTIVKRGEDNEL